MSGASGNASSEVLGHLLQRGPDVRALVRDPAKATLPHESWVTCSTCTPTWLLQAAGIVDQLDVGCVTLTKSAAAKFVRTCAALRYRERNVEP